MQKLSEEQAQIAQKMQEQYNNTQMRLSRMSTEEKVAEYEMGLETAKQQAKLFEDYQKLIKVPEWNRVVNEWMLTDELIRATDNLAPSKNTETATYDDAIDFIVAISAFRERLRYLDTLAVAKENVKEYEKAIRLTLNPEEADEEETDLEDYDM